MIALGWAKAFDTIKPESMLLALRRFGLPDDFLDMIRSIYTSRKFRVHENGNDSSTRRQHSGISQGCPLSPILFSMVMSILITDARIELHSYIGHFIDSISEILYADDTLVIDQHGELAELYMSCISKQGRYYGLSLNWTKIVFLAIGHDPLTLAPDRSPIRRVHSLSYLGGLLTDDERNTSALRKKIGLACRDFSQLQALWSHANISVKKKLQYYHTFIVSKLLYGLDCAWLTKRESHYLDSFHFKCLRRILKVAPSDSSRVSNQTILARSSECLLSCVLFKKQLLLFGRIAGLPRLHPLRQLVFNDDEYFSEAQFRFERRRGRPCLSWTHELHTIAVSISGSRNSLIALMKSFPDWKRTVED